MSKEEYFNEGVFWTCNYVIGTVAYWLTSATTLCKTGKNTDQTILIIQLYKNGKHNVVNFAYVAAVGTLYPSLNSSLEIRWPNLEQGQG